MTPRASAASPAARASEAAPTALTGLHDLRLLLEIDGIPVAGALTRYQQAPATVPFVDDPHAAPVAPAPTWSTGSTPAPPLARPER